MTFNTGQILNNRYRVVKHLAQGGFGAVYRAWDMNLKVPCAIKENPSSQEALQEQFIQEASILATLRHPNLPRVTDFFSIPGMGQYLVMDFIEGKDLQEVLDEQGSLPEIEALNWMKQICDAVTYLHSQDPPIIHRDIKPANIKISSNYQAILVDFGIAKIQRPAVHTALGARAVTPGFSPPEQYGQGSTDVQSDVYALGATLYALLTGRAPEDSFTSLSRGGTLPAANEVNPQISARVSAAIQRAMRLDKAERFPNAEAFFQALTPAAEIKGRSETKRSEVTRAAPAPALTPATPVEQKRAGSARGLWIGLAIAAVLVIVGICAGAVLAGPKLIESYQDLFAAQPPTATATLVANTPTRAPTSTSTPPASSPTPMATAVIPTTPAPTPTQEASPTPAVITLTEWKAVSFLHMPEGCRSNGLPCWKSNDRAAIGYDDVTLTSQESILVDPGWSKPYLLFWHQYDLDGSANVSVKTSAGWQYLKLYSRGRKYWAQESLDLSKYKGQEIIIKFTLEPFHRVSTWFIEDIQIVPEYSP